ERGRRYAPEGPAFTQLSYRGFLKPLSCIHLSECSEWSERTFYGAARPPGSGLAAVSARRERGRRYAPEGPAFTQLSYRGFLKPLSCIHLSECSEWSERAFYGAARPPGSGLAAEAVPATKPWPL
ncbi:hypothetical protein ACLD02_11305, partial [Alloalcanivorax sp. C16-2]|uniref:hypothetical protein n=1 Tax=Alloalcanivorax sp. C16-2 TaxID=3390052 RepID=UPI003970520F